MQAVSKKQKIIEKVCNDSEEKVSIQIGKVSIQIGKVLI